MEFCGRVLCNITCIANTYKSIQRRIQKTQLLYTMVCSNVVRVSAPRTVSVAVGARRAVWGRNIVSVRVFFPCRGQLSLIRGPSAAAGMSSRASRPGLRAWSSVCVVPGPAVTWHGRGVHNFTQEYLLLAASATTARQAERFPPVRASRHWPPAAGASFPRTAGRCCAGRGAMCDAART